MQTAGGGPSEGSMLTTVYGQNACQSSLRFS